MTEVSVRGGGRSLITYRIGGREYPLKTVRQCRVCMSPHRFDIERDLIAGRTYNKIVESLPDDDHGLNARNIADHYRNGHLPLEQATTRAIIEDRAQQVGKSIEHHTESLIDGVTLAKTVVQKTFEAIAKGEIAPEVTDGLRAFKLLADFGEYDEGGADMAAITEAFMVYHEQAQEVMTPEQFEAFGRALSTNPVLKALAAKFDGEAETVEGEVMEDGEEDS